MQLAVRCSIQSELNLMQSQNTNTSYQRCLIVTGCQLDNLHHSFNVANTETRDQTNVHVFMFYCIVFTFLFLRCAYILHLHVVFLQHQYNFLCFHVPHVVKFQNALFVHFIGDRVSYHQVLLQINM